MSTAFDFIPGLVFIVMFLGGIRLMNSPKTALAGNLLGSLGMLFAVLYTLSVAGIADRAVILIPLGAGILIGYFFAVRVAMIEMPQLVALLNGFGGGASALTAIAVITGGDTDLLVASSALLVGGVTLGGSFLAAGKLARIIAQKPVVLSYHSLLNTVIFILACALTGFMLLQGAPVSMISAAFLLLISVSLGVGLTLRVGGADMPITISLLNSLSGIAASITGLAIREPLLVATGAIVGSAGMILTRIMCDAMNRSLVNILLGKGIEAAKDAPVFFSIGKTMTVQAEKSSSEDSEKSKNKTALEHLRKAKTVFFVPGYGMALSQAQQKVKQLSDLLESEGKDVKYAIHPVAGRMPGHMYVLLAEVDVPYEKMLEIEVANQALPGADVVIIVGANDVVNPSASTAQGTPIYGMPVLKVSEAGCILIFNMDTKPGYSGVHNPLYEMENVAFIEGDASKTIGEFIVKYEVKN